MNVVIPYKKNPHQREFDADITTKFLLMTSGYGGGKTHGLLMKILKLSWLNRPYAGGLVVPTLAEYKKDVLPVLEDILHGARIGRHRLIDRCHYHKSDMTWAFPWNKRGKLYVVTAEKRIKGPNWAYCGINEATLIPFMRYREAIGRVRIKQARYRQIAASGTPEGISSEYYEHFVLNPMKGSRIIYGNTEDNLENLADDYVDQLKDSYDEIALAAYLKGLFVNMQGSQFYYALDPVKSYDKKLAEVEHEPVDVTMDFNVDPFVSTIWQKYWNEEMRWLEYHAFDQVVLKGAQTRDMANALKARGYTPDRTTIYPDPAGKARSTKGHPDIMILQNEGFKNIRTRSSAPEFRRRQLGVCNLLDKGRIKLNPDKCTELKRDLEAVEQDPVDFSKLKKNPKLTHASDGMDYYIDLVEPLSGLKPESRNVRIR